MLSRSKPGSPIDIVCQAYPLAVCTRNRDDGQYIVRRWRGNLIIGRGPNGETAWKVAAQYVKDNCNGGYVRIPSKALVLGRAMEPKR
jgi:hypothetical protein